MTMVRNLLGDTKGIGTIEYALVAMLISVAALSAYANLGTKVQTRWSTTSQTITAHLG
jgi:Flp pilus assembly pilin Flp